MLLRRDSGVEVDDHIDMTPMVDVVFQLMTFMLFSMQMSGGENVEVPPAHHGVGVNEAGTTVITLVPPSGTGGEALIYLGNGTTDPAGRPLAPSSPEQVKAAIERGRAEGRARVVLQADGEVFHGDVIRVAAIVGEVEGVSLHVGVQEMK
jgi:biopolymer transport protein ExbD